MDTVITTSHVPIQYQVMREDGQVLWVGNPERVDAVEGDTLTIRQYETMFMPEEARIVYGFYKGTLPGNFSDSTGYETFYKATVIK